ncbi:head completion/stabilization protein [Seminibacterium arietis]|uniref:Head completion/stabilization protein n=1 Tax=Seminibacterium arietis TaxID=1173502 RepID=A0ABW3I7S3_9PAST
MFNGRSEEYSEKILKNNGFWADIPIKEFQLQRAIPLQIPQEMIEAALIESMLGVSLELITVAENYRLKGVQHVSEIPSILTQGLQQNYQTILYKKAVYARAKAILIPEFATLSAREIHEKREYIEEQKSLEAEAVQAIRLLKGKKRGSVCLI